MPHDDWVPVMLTSQSDYRGNSAEAHRSMADLLQALLSTGKPPPLFIEVFGRRDPDRNVDGHMA